ncbi:MAG: hypothetical protein ACR2MP_10285 [Streptosporangiaceae bacterium]
MHRGSTEAPTGSAVPHFHPLGALDWLAVRPGEVGVNPAVFGAAAAGLIDAETRERADVLAGRTAEVLETWLRDQAVPETSGSAELSALPS